MLSSHHRLFRDSDKMVTSWHFPGGQGLFSFHHTHRYSEIGILCLSSSHGNEKFLSVFMLKLWTGERHTSYSNEMQCLLCPPSETCQGQPGGQSRHWESCWRSGNWHVCLYSGLCRRRYLWVRQYLIRLIAETTFGDINVRLVHFFLVISFLFSYSQRIKAIILIIQIQLAG